VVYQAYRRELENLLPRGLGEQLEESRTGPAWLNRKAC